MRQFPSRAAHLTFAIGEDRETGAPMMVPISSESLEGRMAADKTMGVQMNPKPPKRLRADLRKAEQTEAVT